MRFAAIIQCPYICEPYKPREGFLVDILRRALKQTDHTLEIITMPLIRAKTEITRGTIKGILGVTQRDVPGLPLNDEPLGIRQFELYTRQTDGWRFSDPESLNGRVLVLSQGFAYGDLTSYLTEHQQKNLNVFFVEGEHAFVRKFRMLEIGRANTTIEDRYVFEHFALIEGLPEIYQSAGVISTESLHIAFAPALSSQAELSRLLSQYIRQMKQTGEMRKVLYDYGLSEATPLMDTDE